MPRKQRNQKQRRDQPITPALRYVLATGLTANCHACGVHDDSTWRCEQDLSIPPCVGPRPVPGGIAALLMTDAELAEAWEAYGPELIAEAQSYGFKPAGLGEALDPTTTAEWRRDFMRPYGRSIRHREH